MVVKEQVRRELLQIRKKFSPLILQARSRKVCEAILSSPEYAEAQSVMGYLAFGHEISIDRVLQDALKRNKIVAVPYVVSDTVIQAVLFAGFESLTKDRFGIRSVSKPIHFLEPTEIRLILVPGVGFSSDGCRLGMGRGYYDRFLPKTRALTMGITCSELLREDLPCEPYDQKMEILVTETGVHQCR